VHPSFSDMTPVEVFSCFERFNEEMIHRSLMREQIYDLWKVGKPYKNRMLGCIELSNMRKLALTPPHIRRDMKYKEHAKQLRHEINAIWVEYAALAAFASLGLALLSLAYGTWLLYLSGVVLIGMVAISARKANWLFDKMRREVCKPNTQDSSIYDIGTAVLTALQRRNLISLKVSRRQIRITMRADGTYRVFLDGLEPEQGEIFVDSMKEAMAPIMGQPYVVPKYEYFVGGPEPTPEDDDDVVVDARLLPQRTDPDYEKQEKNFFKQYLRGQVKPRVAGYHAVPSLLARSEKGREAFEAAWNKYVSPGYVTSTEKKPSLLDRNFGVGPTVTQRIVWE